MSPDEFQQRGGRHRFLFWLPLGIWFAQLLLLWILGAFSGVTCPGSRSVHVVDLAALTAGAGCLFAAWRRAQSSTPSARHLESAALMIARLSAVAIVITSGFAALLVGCE